MIEGFLAGTIFASSIAIALYFLRYWRVTRDTLFLAFATAFTAQGMGQFAIAFLADHTTVSPTAYGAPLVAYMVVLAVMVTRRHAPDGWKPPLPNP